MIIWGKVSCTDILVDSEKYDRCGYNAGYLLGIKYLLVETVLDHPLENFNIPYNIDTITKMLPNSIVSRYFVGVSESRENIFPSVKRINDCVHDYDGQHDIGLLNLVLDENTLVVHVRSGDFGVISEEFATKVVDLSFKFKKTVLFCGIHGDETVCNIQTSRENLTNSLNMITSKNDSIGICFDSADNHLHLMSKARHLFVHRGAFSVLALLVSTGKVYALNTEDDDDIFNLRKNYRLFIDKMYKTTGRKCEISWM